MKKSRIFVKNKVDKMRKYGNFLVWILFYASLCLLLYVFFTKHSEGKGAIDLQQVLAGDDRIVWENTTKGIIAKEIHPLLSNYQKNRKEKDQIRVGDRLRRVDYQEIYQKETLDTLTVFSNPDHIFIYEIERVNEDNFTREIRQVFAENSYYLTFLFNQNTNFWRASIWLLGLGFFITLLILFILFPLLKNNLIENRILLSLTFSSLFFFGLQLIHAFKLLIINSREDWINTWFEKIFIFLYVCFVCVYMIQYLWFEGLTRKITYIFPSILGAFLLAGLTYQHLFISQGMKTFHANVENAVLLFFFLHLIAANVFLLLKRENSWSSLFFNILTTLISLWAIYLCGFQLFQKNAITHENVLLSFVVLQFYPVINAASLRLKFGKVSLVLGQTIQYIIFFAVSLFSYLLVKQAFTSLLPNNPYREIFEIFATIFLIMSLRSLYLANEKRIRKYFILSQQEKEDNIRTFIAQIPQYTSPEKLMQEVKARLSTYLDAPNLAIWWKGDALVT
ncbi:MAG: hypothetical protein ACKVTZ_04495, partial [Bacteroidia bacterium]